MHTPIRSVMVVGAGSAGYLAAVTMRRLLPALDRVTVVHSPRIPVIGVGESTTALLPRLLHDILGLDRKRFFAEVVPSWKAGIRFEWGKPGDYHFNYPFDGPMLTGQKQLSRPPAYLCRHDAADASHFSALMDRALAPVSIAQGHYHYHEGTGYHIDNKKFLAYLQKTSALLGIDIVTGDIAEVARASSGGVDHLRLEDGRTLAADLFIDCSGFASLLLGEALKEPFISFSDSLFCDTAVVGEWPRDTAVMPYTLAETMDHGWCWQIDFRDHVTRGYVHSSAFCTADDAMREIKAKNPALGDDLRVVKFKSGRYQNSWVHNVLAIGNASGFVEPLEATALHVIGNTLTNTCWLLTESHMRATPEAVKVLNRAVALKWDDIRNFLAIHYKFNKRLDTPFWRHCREKANLHGAQEIVELYQSIGPTALIGDLIPSLSIFGFDGYTTLLVGQDVPTRFDDEPQPEHLATWNAWKNQVRSDIAGALPVRRALDVVMSPDWRWATQGI